MCCTWLGANTGRKKSSKICHLGTIAQLCRAVSLQLRHIMVCPPQVDKNFLSSSISSTCPHNMVNFGPLAAGIGPVVLGTPANFNGFLHLGSITAATLLSGSQPNFVFGRLLGWYTAYTFLGVLAPLRNFARCRIHFASSKSCALVFW